MPNVLDNQGATVLPPTMKSFDLFAIKSVDQDQRTIDAVITTTVRDRDGDIIETSGLDFGNFQKNPVVLWMHDMREPIGRVTSIKQQAKQVRAVVQFAETSQAIEIFSLYAAGYLKAWSIGFMPKRWERIEENSDGIKGFRVLEAEVYEVSAVSVPSNPQALAKAMDAGNIEVSQTLRRDLLTKTYRLSEKGAVIEEGDEGFAVNTDPKDGVWKTMGGKVINQAAFSKSIAEAITKGRVITVTRSVPHPALAGTEIFFQPIQETDEEIKEAKIKSIVLNVYAPKSNAPEENEPEEASTHKSEGRNDSDSDEDDEAAIALAQISIVTSLFE